MSQKPFKFNFALQKSYFALIPVLALGAFLLVFVYAYYSDAGRARVQEGDVAPFASDTGVPTVAGNQMKDLSAQIYSVSDVAEQVKSIVVDSLSLTPQTIQSMTPQPGVSFTPAGLQSYQSFLQNSGMAQAIAQGGYRTNIILESEPQIVAQGVFGGAYKWLYEVPVMIGYLPAQSNADETPQSINRHVVLRIQMTRIPPTDDLDKRMAVGLEIFESK